MVGLGGYNEARAVKDKDWKFISEKQKNATHERVLGSQKGGIFKGQGPDMKNTVTLSWDLETEHLV